MLHNSWIITDFQNSFRDFSQNFPRTWLFNFFSIWRHYLAWWRHLDLALSRISWFLSVFRNFFYENTKKLQILQLIYMFTKARNLTVASTQSQLARLTSKTQINFRWKRYYFEGILIFVFHILSWFFVYSHNLFDVHVFEVKESIAEIPTELPCSGYLKNLSQLPVLEVLIILHYKFLTFLHYLGFRGRGIHFWHSYWATSFDMSDLENLRQLPVWGLSIGTDDKVIWIFTIFSKLMFSRSGNHLLTFWLSCHVWGPRNFRKTFGSRGFRGHPCKVAQ